MIDFLPYFWLAVIIFMAICEITTAQLVSIWFVLGGVAALISSFITDNWLTQVLIFVAVTFITLVITRPFIKKIKSPEKVQTNSDRYIGMTAKVSVEINNSLGKGQVNAEGSIWSARSSDGSVIPEGTLVNVERIEGVKLIVTQIKL